MMTFRFLIGFLAYFLISPLSGQEGSIEVINSSFEGIPRKGVDNFVLNGWRDCGLVFFPGETPPDVHPDNRAWENVTMPSDGNTYVGLVVRDNDSWESITQRLSTPIKADKCYTFSIYLMRSSQYVSLTRRAIELKGRNKMENYQEPVVLRIWGGSGFCNQRELLAESVPIRNDEWAEYTFDIKPGFNHRYFTLEAFYKTPVLFPYNGHILIDNASDIVIKPCPGEEPEEIVAAAEPVQKKVVVPPHKRRKKTEPQVTSEVASENLPTEPEKPKIMVELDREKLKKGQVFKIKNLYFPADKAALEKKSYKVLDEIYTFLEYYKDIVIEIGGHTNGRCEDKFCDKLSEDRAKMVATYLSQKGINASRLQFKGYGRRNLIANDKTAFGRQKNQRVEIKILDFDTTG